MYNRYIPSTIQQEPAGRDGSGRDAAPARPGSILDGLLGRLSGEEGGAGQGLSSLLKSFSLDRLDSGDILLGLIVLLLVLEEGDTLDLIITLALTILLSLGDA